MICFSSLSSRAWFDMPDYSINLFIISVVFVADPSHLKFMMVPFEFLNLDV